MLSVKVALAVGLALLSIALALTLLQSPIGVARTNRIPGKAEETIASTDHSASYCQSQEVLPRETAAVRIWLDAAAGPRVRVLVSSRGQRVTGGERGSNWTGSSVTVPVRPLARSISGATVCVSFSLRDETVVVQGTTTTAALAAHDGPEALAGRIWIEYLRPGRRSWAELASEVARHMGFGRAAAGTWVVFAALALIVAIAALASGLILSEMP
jgi:hypothetical protein